MYRYTLTIFFSLLLRISTLAQGEPAVVDEFGQTPLGDMSGRLDAFLNELNKTPARKGLIRIYSGDKGSLGFPYLRKAFYEAYFNARRGDRYRSTNYEIEICEGTGKELRTKFYFAKPGDTMARCKLWKPATTNTALIKSEGFYPIGDSDSYLGTEGVDAATDKAGLDFIANLLRENPGSRIVLIGYAGRFFEYDDRTEKDVFSKADPIRVNDRAMNAIKRSIVRRGVSGTRITIVRGGHRNYLRSADIWFVPKDGSDPRPTPDSFPSRSN